MEDKRHLVLYGILALGVLLVLLILAYTRMSDSPEPPPDTGTTTMATTSQVALEIEEEAGIPEPPKPFRFEIATDPAAQARGLGGRSEIPSDYGMLFVFPDKEKQGFWMKDMLASIDIIWLSDDARVLGIEEAVSPDTYPSVFYSPEPVRYVLETRAGEARRLNITIGTKLNLPLPYGRGISE